MAKIKISKTQRELLQVLADADRLGREYIERHNARMLADPEKGQAYCITTPLGVLCRTGIMCERGWWAGNAVRGVGRSIRGLSWRSYHALSRAGLAECVVIPPGRGSRTPTGFWRITNAGAIYLAGTEG